MINNITTADESNEEEERALLPRPNRLVSFVKRLRSRFTLLPRFGVAILSSLLIGLLIYVVGFYLTVIEEKQQDFSWSSISFWLAEGLSFIGFSVFGFYATDRYSVTTLLGGRKKIPVMSVKLFVSFTCVTFVLGVYILVGAPMHHNRENRFVLFSEPLWYSILKGLLLIVYSVMFQSLAWFLWFSQMDMPSDGTILPLRYIRCLCLPDWLKQFAFTILPLLILTVLSLCFVVRIWKSSLNLSQSCETHVHLYIVTCASLFMVYVLIATISLFFAKVSIRSRIMSKALTFIIIFTSIFWGIFGESITISRKCMDDASNSGNLYIFHTINLLRALVLSFGLGLFFLSIWCRTETWLETYPIFDSDDTVEM